MSKQNCKSVSNCKQSFKAVENFLRRVAFNLGNTESKTEVKIISCIPIDVTDLQQRIFQLQNELADYKEKDKDPNLCATCRKRAETSPKRQVVCNECLLDTSIISGPCSATHSSKQMRPRDSRDRDDHLSEIRQAAKNKSSYGKKGYKRKVNSPLVYCAQTDTNTPFSNKYSLTDDLTPMRPNTGNKNENLNRSYLADVIQRQYDPRPLTNEFSNLSDISSPVCRDHVSCSPNSPYVESDACSCFHGRFQNVDKYMTNRNDFNKYPTFQTAGKFDKISYYDSKFYDVIPVKEKRIKHTNVIDKHKRKEHKKHNVVKCFPENTPARYIYAPPTLVNLCTLSPARDGSNLYNTTNNKHTVMNKMAEKRLLASTPRRIRDDIDLGPVYMKQVREYKKPNIIMATPQRHNVATDPPAKVIQHVTAVQQTATSAATITDLPVDNTETTLDQIKNILQTVLTEVKTKNNVGKLPSQEKKDAVVQNGANRSYDYGASQLLQSYTYSPYNMNPFIASCSAPMTCSNYIYSEYPGTQGIPFQQYPLLIQPQKHMCNNYYRNSNFAKPIMKYAATAATNTEKAHERSQETEQLIKEIYKSMALNIEESSKDNSFCEYTKPKTLLKKYINAVKVDSDRESRSVAQAISEIFKNTHLRDSTVTETTDTTLNSYLDPNKTKAVSEETVQTDYKTQSYDDQKEHSTKYRRDRETERMSTHYEAAERSDQSDDTVIEDTEDSSTETNIAHVIETKKETTKPLEPKKDKSGIFKKMLKIFQSRRRRRRGDDDTNECRKESESDSDDYHTVYSHKVLDASPKPKKVQTVRSRPHSKVFNSKQPQKRSRTKSPEEHTRNTPYLEQEYRKYWEEKLMFHEQQRQRHSTCTSRPSPDGDQGYRHAYYRHYEARPLLAKPIRQIPIRMASNVSKPRYTVSKNHRHAENHRPKKTACNNNQGNPNVRNNNSGGTTGPHFVTAKNNGSHKAMFAKAAWLKKCKPQCAQQWKDLIING